MKKYSVAVIALDNISAFHLSAPCLVFQDAFIDLPPAFELRICSEEALDVSLSSGFSVGITHDFSIIDQADIVVIPSWPSTLPEPSKQLLNKIHLAHKRNALILGLCLGGYALAKSGLLDGKKATTHWGFKQPFQKTFPNISLDCNSLFIQQETLITSAGTAASLDCCLHVVRTLCGNEIASHIARTMVTAPFRNGGQQQYIPTPIYEQNTSAVHFGHIMDSIANNLTLKYSLDEVAANCAMSRRTFTRQFKSIYGCTFGEWLLNNRLALCQKLLESTNHAIPTIAELTGIGSESVLRKHFKRSFNVTPSDWRRTFKGTT